MQPYSQPSGLNIPMILIVGLPVLILIWMIATYNRFVNLRNLITGSWSIIDTELRRRHDLIPKLVDVVKAYAAHEKVILQRVTEARAKALAASGGTEEQSQAENLLNDSLKHLFMLSEGYPALKADQHFLHLQRELVNTEDRIQSARRFYNGNVRDYNTLIKMFPSSMIANVFRFKKRPYFEVEEAIARAFLDINFSPRP